MQTQRYVKGVITGPQGAGKSTVARFATPRARGEVHPTIGVEYVPYAAPEHTRLHLWDTSGNSLFRTFVMQHMSMCDVALLVYDTSSATSLEALLHEFVPLVPDGVRVLLIGTKVDLRLTAATEDLIPGVFEALHARFAYVDHITLNARLAADRELLAEHVNALIAPNAVEPVLRMGVMRGRRCPRSCCVQ